MTLIIRRNRNLDLHVNTLDRRELGAASPGSSAPFSFPRPPTPTHWNNQDMCDPRDMLLFFCLRAQPGIDETALPVHPHHQRRRGTLPSRGFSRPCGNDNNKRFVESEKKKKKKK